MISQVDIIDGLVGSVAVKSPCKVATTEAITLSGAQTIDGVALTADAEPRERVLVKDQASDIENGIYDVNSGAWTRSFDFDGSRDAVDGTQVLINEGTVSDGYTYRLSATNPVAIGTDSLTFTNAATAATAVADLTAAGIKLDVTVGANITGVGAALYLATDGGFDEADASAAATMPCVAVALESGVGAKTVLLRGFIRKDAWNWGSVGQPVYVSGTTGDFTQTAPSGSGDQVQVVGVAYTADILYFKPDLTLVEVS